MYIHWVGMIAPAILCDVCVMCIDGACVYMASPEYHHLVTKLGVDRVI